MRQRYTVLARPGSGEALLDRLVERFDRRERAETDRIGGVVSLVTHEGCQVNELTGYFGEVRDEPCGHCSFCLTGEARRLPERRRRLRSSRSSTAVPWERWRPSTRRLSARRDNVHAFSAGSRVRQRAARS